MVKKMFKIVELEDCEIKQYVFLTDAESVESQLADIYDALKDKLGSSFTVIVDTLLRGNLALERFVEIKFVDGKYAGGWIKNFRDIPYELEKESEYILMTNMSLLDNSLWSKSDIESFKKLSKKGLIIKQEVQYIVLQKRVAIIDKNRLDSINYFMHKGLNISPKIVVTEQDIKDVYALKLNKRLTKEIKFTYMNGQKKQTKLYKLIRYCVERFIDTDYDDILQEGILTRVETYKTKIMQDEDGQNDQK